MCKHKMQFFKSLREKKCIRCDLTEDQLAKRKAKKTSYGHTSKKRKLDIELLYNSLAHEQIGD